MRYEVLHSGRLDVTVPSGGRDGTGYTLVMRVNEALKRGATLFGGVSCDAAGNYLQAVIFPED